MRVGTDSDGVLDNFHMGVKNTLIATGQGHVWKSGPKSKSYWNYFEDWGWDWPRFKELCDYGVDNGLIFTGHFFDDARESIERIRSLGHEVILITDRSFGSDPMNSRKNTIEAYERAGIHYDEIHFTSDKTSVHVETMVEDKLENYDALINNGTPTWLINREWNEIPGGDMRNRIDGISQYADAIESITEKGYADLTIV